MKQESQPLNIKPQPSPLAAPITNDREIEPPEITSTLDRVSTALEMASKAKPRTHRCRECEKPDCPHFERIYDDNGEQFDLLGAPDMDRP